MPVLSDPSSFQVMNFSYLLVGITLFIAIWLVIRQRFRSPQPLDNPSFPYPEKVSSLSGEQMIFPSKNIMPRPMPPPPVVPPPTYSEAESQIYYSPTETNSNSSFNSFEFEAVGETPPRRRSYTKSMSSGGEVTGEIIVAEGWRRHTRVFGGGVCLACEESERKMSA